MDEKTEKEIRAYDALDAFCDEHELHIVKNLSTGLYQLVRVQSPLFQGKSITELAEEARLHAKP